MHHEIEEIDSADMASADRTRLQGEHLGELMRQYPSSEFDVFLQGFDTLSSLYGSWPELNPTAST